MLAREIGSTPQQIHFWLNFARKGATAAFVLKIEAATGVPRHELRPDVFKAAA